MSTNSSFKSPKRFLLIRTDRIGDIILTLPVVTALRKIYPDAFIAFLSRSYTLPLIEQYNGIDLLLTYEPEGRHKGWKGVSRLGNELEELNFQTALLFYPRFELAFALFKAKIPSRIGTGFRWYSFLMNKLVFEHRKECKKHESEYNLALLETLIPEGNPIPQYEFKEWIPDSWWKNFQTELKSKNYVIVHPGSGDSAPNLNKSQYKLIIRNLLENTDCTILLTGIVGEELLIHDLAKDFPEERVKKTVGRFTLKDFFSVVRNSSLLIASSTGPLHMANAAKVPILGFFCPAKPHSPARWGPYNQQNYVVTPKINEPETCDTKNCPHGGCLQKLSDMEITEELCAKRLKNLQK